ncbi:hypothetical protein COLO4_16532 [Corchorus olitorius]|uniref:Uncharacterized protein n=1 Tax=Corchorus olitorius TaxID=93759 RepID=A0A1R3JH00_9ROSI|nr:hypothetical protein COLO4_16532 [Corchorus olitorius]
MNQENKRGAEGKRLTGGTKLKAEVRFDAKRVRGQLDKG